MPDNLIDKLFSGKRLKNEEFILLDKLLNDLQYQQEIFAWMEKNWQQSQPETVELQFQQIREEIRISSAKSRINRLFIVLSKAAAILFIPLLVAALYFYATETSSAELLTLSTQKGEQTSVILPDGSKVWLNVDTKLSYPVDYGIKSRNLELDGEAYFEVVKNEKLPFEVTSGKITTKALGTRFVISAYSGSSIIKSSLVAGSVEIEHGKNHNILKPGQQLIVNKSKHDITIKSFNAEYELAWKNDQLVFQLTPFNNVIAELEKWYDIKIDYNPAQFQKETLTVRFEKYETLEKVLQVIAKANGFKYTINGNNIVLYK